LICLEIGSNYTAHPLDELLLLALYLFIEWMLSSRAAGIRMETLSDDDLFRVIKEGGLAIGKSSQMAAWEGILSDQTIEDLVTYLRALAK
jgi:hypothetical protein